MHLTLADGGILRAPYVVAADGLQERLAHHVPGQAQLGAVNVLLQRGPGQRQPALQFAQIQALGLRIAGYSLNADGGSLLGAMATEHRVEAARDGDVLIAHVNQPTHPAGAGW